MRHSQQPSVHEKCLFGLGKMYVGNFRVLEANMSKWQNSLTTTDVISRTPNSQSMPSSINPLQSDQRRSKHMAAWQMAQSPTWAPGVKEQDEINPAWCPQAQRVAAHWCVRGAADGQRHHVPRRAGDSGAPPWRINFGRESEGGPGAVLLRGLGPCVQTAWKHDIDRKCENSQVMEGSIWVLGNGKFAWYTSVFSLPNLV